MPNTSADVLSNKMQVVIIKSLQKCWNEKEY